MNVANGFHVACHTGFHHFQENTAGRCGVHFDARLPGGLAEQLRPLAADGDVEALSALIDDKLPKGNRLLHAGNEEARGDLTGRLRSAGFSAEFLAIFRAVANPTPGPVLQGHLAGPPGFEAVLVHSPRGAAILAGFAAGRAAPLDVAAISPAAAAPLALIAGRTEIAVHPDEQSLFSALARLVSG